jgi:hypothetical protein
VSVTLVGTASGSFFMSSTGEPPVEIVEHLLLEALKECAHMKVHAEHKDSFFKTKLELHIISRGVS